MVLVGPPVQNPWAQQEKQLTTPATNNAFLNNLITNSSLQAQAQARRARSISPPPRNIMGYTRNNSATLTTSTNPCLDLFFKVVPTTPTHSLEEMLTNAWDHNPLTTLKLICNLRGINGFGKSDKTGFYSAALWLHKNHPKTLACNLTGFAKFGYFKDFPEILFRVLGLTHPRKMPRGQKSAHEAPFKPKPRGKKKVFKSKMRDVRMRESKDRQTIEKKVARELRHKKNSEMITKAVERYKRDPEYRFLHDRVAELFAEKLIRDFKLLGEGKVKEISLAAKWCPSLGSCFDRGTLLCEGIARRVFPKEDYEEYKDVDEVHYAYRVRDRLRKEVLVPLRKALELPEVFMSANKWDEVKYNRVASVAMKMNKEHFLRHDEERFREYLEDVKSGKAKIAAGAVFPHEIIGSLSDGDGGEVAELQWMRMVEDMSKEGTLTNCIAVCDVSESMEGTPMEVCVSLGLLLSELAAEPWKGKIITFSEDPELHIIQGDDLKSKTQFIRTMNWGERTNFKRVFDLILDVAVYGKLKGEELVKRVFVFSDMEFDNASVHPWETDYMRIRRKFERKGYGYHVPEIVFWNLRDSKSIPVSKNQEGCALVSGFSKNAMKLFLEGKEDALEPQIVMMKAISGEEYNDLVVLD